MTKSEIKAEAELVASDKQMKTSRSFMRAARNFFQAGKEGGITGAVHWYQSADGELVIYTRGEYRKQLMENIHQLPGQGEYVFKTTRRAK